jgi:hypothetical protein
VPSFERQRLKVNAGGTGDFSPDAVFLVLGVRACRMPGLELKRKVHKVKNLHYCKVRNLLRELFLHPVKAAL